MTTGFLFEAAELNSIEPSLVIRAVNRSPCGRASYLVDQAPVDELQVGADVVLVGAAHQQLCAD